MTQPSAAGTSKRILNNACLVIAFLLPLKLVAVYIVLVPTLLLWLYLTKFSVSLFKQKELCFVPFAVFIAMLCLSSLTGLAPLRSLNSLISFSLGSLTIPLFAQFASPLRTVSALAFGQAIAGLHTIFERSLSPQGSEIFLGAVTESGQLTLTILLVITVIFYQLHNSSFKLTPLLAASSLMLGATLLYTGFAWNIAPSTLSFAIICSSVLLMMNGYLCQKKSAVFLDGVYFTQLILPILLAALIINLKRGPWLGVTVGVLVLLIFLRQLKLSLLLVSLGGILCALPPVTQRILDSYRDFTIPGGRSLIWSIGSELLGTFPLGIGFNNSKVLRQFSSEIPSELRHFHSNVINIAVEGGWLALAAFMWWLISLCRIGFRPGKNALLRAGFAAALVAWQVAGIGEYNVGDSEVLLIAFICCGLLAACGNQQVRELQTTRSPNSILPPPPLPLSVAPLLNDPNFVK